MVKEILRFPFYFHKLDTLVPLYQRYCLESVLDKMAVLTALCVLTEENKTTELKRFIGGGARADMGGLAVF
jgi:hypothetical protein